MNKKKLAFSKTHVLVPYFIITVRDIDNSLEKLCSLRQPADGAIVSVNSSRAEILQRP